MATVDKKDIEILFVSSSKTSVFISLRKQSVFKADEPQGG